MVNEILHDMDDDLNQLYDYSGRPSITPYIAPRQQSRTIDGRTTRHKTYQVSQRKRKRVEEIFGWAKTVGVIRKAKMRGWKKIDWLFTMNIAVFNLVRMRNLEAMG